MFDSKAFIEHLRNRDWVFCLLNSLALNLVIELLARQSLIGLLRYIFTSGHMFLFNVAFLFVLLLISQLFHHKTFVSSLISLLWLILGVINGIIMIFRTTPFSAADLRISRSAILLLPRYLKWVHWVLLGILLVLIGFGIAYIFRREKRKEVNYRKSFLLVGVSLASFAAVAVLFLMTGMRPRGDVDIAANYNNCGFPYCFTYSVFRSGVRKPEAYSQETLDDLKQDLEGNPNSQTDVQTPNIVFVQLESFFNLDRMDEDIIRFSKRVQPVFNSLLEHYPSGQLTVPSIGGGTANTEFEVLTGMSLEHFGLGEYPYKTILQDNTCESIPYNLKPLGYRSHAVHNYTATFYDRNIIYSQLGFDTFTSLEYMTDVKYNALGWAMDTVLIPETLEAMRQTEERDFVFNVSVQGHGRYPDEMTETPELTAHSDLLSETEVANWTYYANEMNSMDAFIGAMIGALSAYDEPVVAVLYGDHLPAISLEEEWLSRGNRHQTEYVIWYNQSYVESGKNGVKEAEDQDLYTYQLSARLMTLLDFHEGMLTRLHQSFSGEKNYKKMLELLEYDMLYGEHPSSEEEPVYEKTDMRMGLVSPEILRVVDIGGRLYVIGKNFTPYCRIQVGEEILDTLFMSDNLIVIDEELPEDIPPGGSCRLLLCYVAEDGTKLSDSVDYLFQPG
ncbi:MAG: LTA synthase family protein [Clostridia bacterium]|nr:LTA synthase family protein [Clostridia bacterium]